MRKCREIRSRAQPPVIIHQHGVSDLELQSVIVSGIGEDEVGESLSVSGSVDQVPDVGNAVRIGLVDLVLANPIGFERMSDVCSIEVVGIDVEVAADKRAGLIAELLEGRLFAILLGKASS